MFDFFEVGGAVRDRFLGINSKDVDFVCVPSQRFETAEEAFEALICHLRELGFRGFDTNGGDFIIKPEFFVIRAMPPVGHSLHTRTAIADFVLARKDGPSSDGRRPDFVLPGTLHDDLTRRDFTVNAMAIDLDGNLIDPHNGLDDVKTRTLRFVGDPAQRIAEDGLRVFRMFRFAITKGFEIDDCAWKFVFDNQRMIIDNHLGGTHEERIRDELTLMFSANTLLTLDLLNNFGLIKKFIFTQTNLKLMPTSRQF